MRTSIDAERERIQDPAARSLVGETPGEKAEQPKQWDDRSWTGMTKDCTGAQGFRKMKSEWEQRRRKRMQLWEAPPPGPPKRCGVGEVKEPGDVKKRRYAMKFKGF